MAAPPEQPDAALAVAERPACWGWPDPGLPVYGVELAKLLAHNAAVAADPGRDPDDRVDDPAGVLRLDLASPERFRWRAFHAGRCAICGDLPDRLLDDHDHATGLMRGLLCQSCNLRVGHGWDGAYEAYCQRPPAAILGYRAYYVGFAWTPRWWENPDLGRHLTGDPAWQRFDGVRA